MTFQAYLDNIEDKTGLTPRQFIDLATEKGFGPGTKSGEIVAWLGEDYGLGRGHAMALVHVITKGRQDQRQARRTRARRTPTRPTRSGSTARRRIPRADRARALDRAVARADNSSRDE